MVFNVLLNASLIIFAAGLTYKVATWFYYRVGITAEDTSIVGRIIAVSRHVLGIVLSERILILFKAFLLDVLLQVRILKQDKLRWLMHMLIFWGFMLLLLMHALDDIVSRKLFSGYYSTVNPYFFLRDFFGVMVLAGVGIALYRRFILKVPRLKTNAMDKYAIIILAVIMLSGLLLEGLRITSHSEFMYMVNDYAGMGDEQEILALESYWVEKYGLASPNVRPPFDSATLDAGRSAHEMNCMDCHAPAQWAFASFAVAGFLKPVAVILDKIKGTDFLWYVHIIACFFGLAYLPFSKMLHIFTTPISLMARAISEDDEGTSAPDAAIASTRQAMELDACTHCGTCSLHCSAMMAYEVKGNEYILPSEKMMVLKRVASGKEPDAAEMQAVIEGIYLCTNCDRCTVVCPSGINLKDLWINVREDLVRRGGAEPLILSQFSFVRGLNRHKFDGQAYAEPVERVRKVVAGHFESLNNPENPIALNDTETTPESVDPTFAYCFSCQNCSTVCPVVGNYEDPQESVGLLPHQIMCCLGLGMVEMAKGASMVYDCVTCYQCQEHCPQKVKVADLLYQLRNLAAKDANAA